VEKKKTREKLSTFLSVEFLRVDVFVLFLSISRLIFGVEKCLKFAFI
jgi:hypothetical protein